MSLHDEIINLSGDTPSVFLSKETLSYNVLKSLSDALFEAFSQPVKVNPKLNYGAHLTKIQIGSKGGTASKGDISNNNVELEDGKEDNEAILQTQQTIILKVRIGFVEENYDASGHITYSLIDEFSTASLVIKKLSFRLIVANNSISSASGAADAGVLFSSEDDIVLQSISQKHGVPISELHRMEGVIGSGIQTMFAKILDDAHTIDFVDLFPGLQMEGRIKPKVASDKKNLILLPTQGISFDPGGTSGCNGIGDGMGDFDQGEVVSKPSSEGDTGTISVGGISPPKPETSLGVRREGIGDIGIYLPRSTAKKITPQVIPGVRVSVGSGGTLSWQAEAFAGFTGFNISFNDSAGAIEAEIEFTLDAHGWLEADLGKILGRHRIGAFSIDQGGQVNTVWVSFLPVISDGQVVIKPIIKPGTNISNFRVSINLGKFFGLIFGSFGAATGFIFDTILARLIRNKLPGKIREKVGSSLSKSAWTLIDIREWKYLIEGGENSVALYDVNPDSILVSLRDLGNDTIPPTTVGDTYPAEYG